MTEKLTIKNFGPIRDAEIEVKDMMVFIGAQSSGKSTLAKLITILNDFNFRQNFSNKLENELEKYNLKSFLKKNTLIEYKSLYFTYTYTNKNESKFDYNEFLKHFMSKINPDKDDLKTIKIILGLMVSAIVFDGKSHILKRELQKDDYFGFSDELDSIFDLKNINNREKIIENLLKVYNKKINLTELTELGSKVRSVFSFIRPLDSMYIPAERTIIPLIVNNIAGLINNKVLMPYYVLHAVQEFEKSLQIVDNFDLNIIGNLRFKRNGGKSYIYHNRNQKVFLREASSGVQSILPILLLIESSNKTENYINLNYVVEEPELNLYPEAQYELIKHLVKNCLETDHKVQSKNLIITTHSPYILASINNLLLSYKKGQTSSEKINKIIDKESWINPFNFNAYEVKDGGVEKIFNYKSKLIEDTIIDEVSEIIMEDFKEIASIND
ncbi:AAA family ATPase [Polaribacter batillariae]|uniref:AAA family ATPase n=1 Tax=Polaribacter batillariae TaxID=2808900 RepID=A0ABX7T149_9FLAO|nr:AAA family ATPase [Polaribacter batillariae]QTD39225.1 AAA family ATPase [Polaribacter batillariae]